MTNNKNKQKKKVSARPCNNKTANLEARVRKLEQEQKKCCAMVISPDTKKYMHALTHLKWNSKYDNIPTVPDTNNLPTYRQVVKVIGNGVVGTSGVGYVKVRPLSMMSNAGQAVGWTDAAHVGSTFDPYFTASQLQSSDSSVNTGSLPTLRAPVFRTVACTLNVRNKDPSLTRAGTVYLVSSLDNYDISTMNASSVMTFPSTKIEDFSSAAEHKTFWYPQQERDIQFVEPSQLNNSNTDPTAIGALIVAAPGTKFYFEVAAIVEISGEQYMSVSVPGVSDFSGYSMIKDYLGARVSSVLDMARTSVAENLRNAAYEASRQATYFTMGLAYSAYRTQHARATMMNDRPLPIRIEVIE